MSNKKTALTIFLLSLGAFVTGTAEFVFSGILEIISLDLGVSIAAAGQLLTMYSLSYAAGALILVLLTAKYNRKKVLMYAIFTFLIGNLIAFVSYSYSLLMFSRVVMAMSGGLYIVVATNYAAQIVSPEKRGSAIAKIITGFTVSLVLGVPIGTFFSAYVDWRYIFLIIALISLFLIISLYKLLPEIQANKPLPFTTQLQIMKDRRLMTGLGTTIFWILGYTMVFAYISPLLSREAGMPLEMISVALFVLGTSAFIGSRFGGFAVDKWGPARTISISLIIHAIGLLLFTFTLQSTVGTFLTIMIWGVATWTTTPAKQFYLISLKPQSSEIVLSFNTALMNIGMTMGAGLGGLIVKYVNLFHLTWIASVFVVIALLFIRVSFRLNKEKNRIPYPVDQKG
ncbi:MFS transporter [Halalkalibacterium halodurans]|uniref:MFS transporter n=1 Tax=Halalkalibacterium halodurans TaxID=86665 RepID=UPI002AAA029E|nr:MFS transporter [Halalkalibacterium halodurans]MDY7222675.1 MFS transporter [Halalkalibacterium halodurans]MDY7241896.1 MFS transporter [Halalkalibacterium halodurans]